MQELEAKAKEVNERLEALAEVEAWQEERANLERALAWAPARILRADLEKNANLLEVLGPRDLEQARLPHCVPALNACFGAALERHKHCRTWCCLQHFRKWSIWLLQRETSYPSCNSHV